MTLDIHGLMQELSESRPIFHSEADFQLALFRLINEKRSDCQIRMEEPFQFGERKNRLLDIWLPEEGVAIELKFFTTKICLRWGHEPFSLKEQASADLARKSFLWDVQRIERLTKTQQRLGHEEQPVKAGFAVFLTNAPTLWDPKRRRKNTNDTHYRLHEGREVTGKLEWLKRGQPNKNEKPVCLYGYYKMGWQGYSNLVPGKYGGEFRYLAFPIQPNNPTEEKECSTFS